MASDVKLFNPASDVLRNVGTKVRIHRTVETGTTTLRDGTVQNTYARADGVEEVRIAFTTYELAMIEDTFGSIMQWQEDLGVKMYGAVIKTLSVITGRTGRDIAAAIDMTKIEEYQFAIVTAWLISAGADEKGLGKVLMNAGKIGELRAEVMKAVLDIWTQPTPSLTQNGFDTGSSPEETPTSSGEAAPTRSDSSSTASPTSTDSVKTQEPLKETVVNGTVLGDHKKAKARTSAG